MDNNNVKRLFFALEVLAPWPAKLPHGRIMDDSHRHMTLAFLGSTDYRKLQESLKRFPYPPFRIGFAGKFNEPLFLPPRHPHVAAWHVQWLEDAMSLDLYQKSLTEWLVHEGFNPDIRDHFLPHVTICRSPFNPREWGKAFTVLPMMTANLHLYESMGSLQYIPRWTCPIKPPFVEFEHTADIAYKVYGENLEQIKLHAAAALAFKCPEILTCDLETPVESIEDVIIKLNECVAYVDQRIGCPYKAVSFHGDIEEEEEGIMSWEMIVDV